MVGERSERNYIGNYQGALPSSSLVYISDECVNGAGTKRFVLSVPSALCAAR